MPRNPFWTSTNVADTLALSEFRFPDGSLTFTATNATSYDNQGVLSGQFTSGEAMDFILVDLKVGSTYNFLATGTYQVSLFIYDMQGYLLNFVDADDIGIPDTYPQDSIVNFKPDYSGTYKLEIFYKNLTTTGTYTIAGGEDIYSNGKNDYIKTPPIDSNMKGAIEVAIQGILRLDTSSGIGAATYNDYVAKYSSGSLSLSAIISDLTVKADSTTSVATLAYQFFTGHTPSSAGYNYLVSPTGPNSNSLNSVYYQSFNLENRYINFAVNLGKNGEGKDSFTATYGALTLAQATKMAYATIFGIAPTDQKVAVLLSGGRDAYFASYGGDGPNGIGTKAAMVGWLLAEAEKADIGMYAKSNHAYLTDLISGGHYQVDLVGSFGKPDYAYGG